MFAFGFGKLLSEPKSLPLTPTAIIGNVNLLGSIIFCGKVTPNFIFFLSIYPVEYFDTVSLEMPCLSRDVNNTSRGHTFNLILSTVNLIDFVFP